MVLARPRASTQIPTSTFHSLFLPLCLRRDPRGELPTRGEQLRRRGNIVGGVNMTVLNQFAANSGGQAFLLSDTFIDKGSSDLDKVLTTIARGTARAVHTGLLPFVFGQR